MERFRKGCDAVRKDVDGSPRHHQAPLSRGRIPGPELVNQVDAPFNAQVGVDKHHVVLAWVHSARLRKRGSDIDLVPTFAENPADQSPHLIHVIDDQHPLRHLISRHFMNQLESRPHAARPTRLGRHHHAIAPPQDAGASGRTLASGLVTLSATSRPQRQ